MAKKRKDSDLVPSPLSMSEFDAKGIPLEAGNRAQRRLMAKGTSKEVQDAYNAEPIWQKMEKIMKTLKAWYAVNMSWLQFDAEAKAVLNSMQKEHEQREEDIRKMVADSLKGEHRIVDAIFDRAEKVMREACEALSETEVSILVAEAREAEHKRLDTLFARVEDAKVLKNQLYSMQKEHLQLRELSRIQTAKRKSEGKAK